MVQLVFGMALVAAALAVSRVGSRPVRLAGQVGMLLGGAGLVATAVYAARRPPRVILDQRGIDDRRGFGWIAWDEICSVVPQSTNRGTFLQVEVQSPQAYWKRLKPWRRRALRAVAQANRLPVRLDGLEPAPEAAENFLRQRGLMR